MRRRFFVEQFEGKSATLRGEGAEHLGRVLRAAPGQLYELSDGLEVWLARVERVAISKKGENCIEFALVEPIDVRESKIEIHLLISVVKFDRFEWCLEKATELGAAKVFPVAAARTDKALIAAAAKRAMRWKKILLESAQQSRRLRPPILESIERSADAFGKTKAEWKIILSEGADAPLINRALRDSRPTSVALAIGPEGGWTEEENSAARAAGFLEVSLGETILRTETAVLAALAVLRFALNE